MKRSSYLLLWPWKGSLMKTQTWILDNRLYYKSKIELHRKGKKSCTVCITPIAICPSGSEISVLVMGRRVHYSKMGKVLTTLIKQERIFFLRLECLPVAHENRFNHRLSHSKLHSTTSSCCSYWKGSLQAAFNNAKRQ